MTENKEETAKVTHNFGSDFLTSDRLRRQKKRKILAHTYIYTETRKQEREREHSRSSTPRVNGNERKQMAHWAQGIKEEAIETLFPVSFESLDCQERKKGRLDQVDGN